MKKYPTAICEECEQPFTLNRVDKQFCSGRCKSKNFRRHQKEKMNLLERLFEKLPQAKRNDLFGEEAA